MSAPPRLGHRPPTTVAHRQSQRWPPRRMVAAAALMASAMASVLLMAGLPPATPTMRAAGPRPVGDGTPPQTYHGVTAVVVVSAGGVGTSSFMRALAAALPQRWYRVNTVENSDELKHTVPSTVMWHLVYHLLCRQDELNEVGVRADVLAARLRQHWRGWPNGTWGGGAGIDASMGECSRVRVLFLHGPPLLSIQSHYDRGIARDMYPSLTGWMTHYAYDMTGVDPPPDMAGGRQPPALPWRTYADFIRAQADSVRASSSSSLTLASAAATDQFGIVRQFAAWAACDQPVPLMFLNLTWLTHGLTRGDEGGHHLPTAQVADFLGVSHGTMVNVAQALAGYQRKHSKPTLPTPSREDMDEGRVRELQQALVEVGEWYSKVEREVMAPWTGKRCVGVGPAP